MELSLHNVTKVTAETVALPSGTSYLRFIATSTHPYTGVESEFEVTLFHKGQLPIQMIVPERKAEAPVAAVPVVIDEAAA